MSEKNQPTTERCHSVTSWQGGSQITWPDCDGGKRKKQECVVQEREFESELRLQMQIHTTRWLNSSHAQIQHMMHMIQNSCMCLTWK